MADLREMCGTPTAQSIEELATWMTLNMFYYISVSSKTVTLGVPHLNKMIIFSISYAQALLQYIYSCLISP